MAATKNIIMRQYNGTDYDIVYPKSLTSLIDGAWNLDNVYGILGTKYGGTGGKELTNMSNCQFMEYTGTGTVSMTTTFDFKPFMVVFSSTSAAPTLVAMSGQSTAQFVQSGSLSTSVKTANVSWNENSVTLSHDSDASIIFNSSGVSYICAAFGVSNNKNHKTQLIIESGTFIVPETASYYIELHGGGGGACFYTTSYPYSGWYGGSSGQYYENVQLTAGTAINVIIGAGGESRTYNYPATDTPPSAGGATSFGSYSVDGGGAATQSAVGSGSGNLGKSGIDISSSGWQRYGASGGGAVGLEYGTGGYIDTESQSTFDLVNGRPGAVYLRWTSNEE